MYCPKCGGGAFVADEELIKIMKTVKPVKIILKQSFICRACTERFSRIVWDDLESRKRAPDAPPSSGMDMFSVSDKTAPATEEEEDASAGIRFLDRI